MNERIDSRPAIGPLAAARKITLFPAIAVLLIAIVATSPRSFGSPSPLANLSPEEAGLNAEALEDAVRLFRDAVDNDDIRGAVILIAHQGRVVLHEAIGWRDKENRLPMEKDTLFRMASNTKAVIATGALILVEDGVLSLDDPVAKYIPAFQGDLAKITVGQLITNSSGLPRGPIFLRGVQKDSNLVLEAERFAATLELETAPGTAYRYSNAGYNILGAVIEAVSAQRLEKFLHERIYEPLGMQDSLHHESVADHSRMARVYVRNEDGWRVRWSPGDDPTYPIVRASGGMISTAWDYAVFLQTWLNGGSTGAVRILSEESIQEGRSIQSATGSYGFGWRINDDGSFSHGGSDGTFAWGDPERGIIGLVFTQSPRGNNPREQFRRLVTQAITDVAGEAVAPTLAVD